MAAGALNSGNSLSVFGSQRNVRAVSAPVAPTFEILRLTANDSAEIAALCRKYRRLSVLIHSAHWCLVTVIAERRTGSLLAPTSPSDQIKTGNQCFPRSEKLRARNCLCQAGMADRMSNLSHVQWKSSHVVSLVCRACADWVDSAREGSGHSLAEGQDLEKESVARSARRKVKQDKTFRLLVRDTAVCQAWPLPLTAGMSQRDSGTGATVNGRWIAVMFLFRDQIPEKEG